MRTVRIPACCPPTQVLNISSAAVLDTACAGDLVANHIEEADGVSGEAGKLRQAVLAAA